jgi:hypothetical protein
MAVKIQIVNRIAKTRVAGFKVLGAAGPRSDKNRNLEISFVQASPRTAAIKAMAPPAINGLRLPQEELQ